MLLRVLSLGLAAAALGAARAWRERASKAQQRRLEALVVDRTAAFQVALETRDVFLQTLIHDLKAPVAALAWYVQVVRREVREGHLDTSVLNEGLNAIGLSASEVVAALDELHDLTQLAAGASLPLRRTSVDLVELARQATNSRVESSRHDLHFEGTEANLIIEGDPARLARVFENLLDNATKYGSLDEPATISVERANAEGSEWAVLRVQDHGIGIPPGDLAHIFERYYRGQNVGSIDGKGLGLASVRRLVELHGGCIDVESELGVGTTLTVKLPLSPAGRPVVVHQLERANPRNAGLSG